MQGGCVLPTNKLRTLRRPFYKPPEKKAPGSFCHPAFCHHAPHTLPRFYPLLGWRSKFGSLPHVLRHSYEHPKTLPQRVGVIVPLSTNPHFLSCSFPAYLKASVCTLWSCNISVTGSFSASVVQNANLDDARPALILVKGEGA